MADERTGTDRIRVTGITAFGYHGVLEHERRTGQTFVADVVLHVDTRPAAARDDLALTSDYGVLSARVAEVLAGEPADLVETVAERIAALVLTDRRVEAVDVVLHKPQAPIEVPFADVAVEIHRSRTHLPSVLAPEPPAVPQAPVDVRPDAPLADALGPLPTVTFPAADALAAGAAAVAGAVGGLAPGAVVPVLEPLPGLAAPVPPVPGPQAPRLVPLPPAPGGAAEPVPASTPPGPEGAPSGDRFDVVPEGPVDVVLALGSNMGASQDTLRRAVAELDLVPGLEITAVAPLARTAAVGGPEQPDYLNTVVVGTTTLSPRALLHECQQIEERHGRVRAERWGARTLDVDIVVHGTTIGVADDLELPHPRAHQRAFVLEPWAQVSPGAVLPGLGGGPVAALAETAPDRGGIRWLALDWWVTPEAGA